MGTLSYITSNNNSGAGNRTASFTPTGVGQLIILGVISNTTNNLMFVPTDNQNNKYNTILTSTAGPSVGLWYAFASVAAATTYTITISTSVNSASFVAVYSSTDGAYSIDGVSWATGNSLTAGGGSVNAAGNNDWLISLICATNFTNPSGFTTRTSTGTVAGRLSDSNGAVSSGANSPTWAINPAVLWASINVLVNPDAPAAGISVPITSLDI